MTHRLEGGDPSPWVAEHLVLVEHNAKCLRCGHGAFEGLFSVTCQRPGGCKTLDERVGEPRIYEFPSVVTELRYEAAGSPDVYSLFAESGEQKWTLSHKHGRNGYYATKELAVAAWKQARAEELTATYIRCQDGTLVRIHDFVCT